MPPTLAAPPPSPRCSRIAAGRRERGLTDSRFPWLAIAIGTGLGVTAIAALVAVNSRRVRRLQRPRITA